MNSRYNTDNDAARAMGSAEEAMRVIDTGPRKMHVFPRDKRYGGGYSFVIFGKGYKITSHAPDRWRFSIEGKVREGNMNSHGYEGIGSTLREAINDTVLQAREDALHILEICKRVL